MANGFFGQFGAPSTSDTGAAIAGGSYYDPNISASRVEDASTLRGRFNLFNRFLAGQPAYGAMTDRGQYLQQQRFNPLSAQFQLTQANAPATLGGQDFRDFLGTSPAVQSRQALIDQINAARGLFPTGGLTGGTVAQEAARNALAEEGTGANIATQAMLAGLNPFLRKTGQNVAEQRLQAFRDQNTGMSLFEALLGGAFGGGIAPPAA